MKIANEWADGEDSVCNEYHDSSKEEGDQGTWGHRDSHINDCSKHKPRTYDDAEAVELVAAGYSDAHEEQGCDNGRQQDQGRDDHWDEGNRRREW